MYETPHNTISFAVRPGFMFTQVTPPSHSEGTGAGDPKQLQTVENGFNDAGTFKRHQNNPATLDALFHRRYYRSHRHSGGQERGSGVPYSAGCQSGNTRIRVLGVPRWGPFFASSSMLPRTIRSFTTCAVSFLLRGVSSRSGNSLCRGLESRWFAERFHGNALVTHFQHSQVLSCRPAHEHYAVSRAAFISARPRGDAQLMWFP